MREEEMLKMRLNGKSYAEIGETYGITKQRVYQILKPFSVSRRYVLKPQNKNWGVFWQKVRDCIKRLFKGG